MALGLSQRPFHLQLNLEIKQPPDIEAVCRACKKGDLATLKDWKKRKELPNLMSQSEDDWYPHEIAAEFDEFEVLKWLVTKSGQNVDPTVRDHLALQLACGTGNVSLIRWLAAYAGVTKTLVVENNAVIRAICDSRFFELFNWVSFESGQFKSILEAGTDWLADCQVTQLRLTALAGYGLATESSTTPDQIRQLISASKIMPEASHLTKLLRAFKIRAERRSPFYQSAVCREAAEAGVISSKEQLRKLARPAQPRSRQLRL